jgi:hypothetical protein
MRSSDLTKKLLDHPFQPFRIHLDDGRRIDMREPGNVIVGASSAVVPTEFGKDEEGCPIVRNWSTISIGHIVRFTDLSQQRNGKRRGNR